MNKIKKLNKNTPYLRRYLVNSLKPYFQSHSKTWKSKKGSIRGGHFHQYTRELFYILKGKIEIKIQEVKNKKLFGEQRIINVNPNDIFLIEPNYIHTFKIIEDAEWINVLSKKIDKKNPDILKLEKWN